jgi:hypothetical protein
VPRDITELVIVLTIIMAVLIWALVPEYIVSGKDIFSW